MPPRVVVFVDRPEWHTRRLLKAFAARGVEALPVALSSCGFATEGKGIAIPGLHGALPDLAFVRTVASGSFEQVTHRLGILHALAAMGVAVVNDARAIERCVDKSTTSAILHRAGLPTPATWSTEGRAGAEAILRRETEAGNRVVLKPLFGSQGRGLKRLGPGDALPEAETIAGVYYLQRLVPQRDKAWHDWRVFVVGGRAVAAMIRHGKDWITNVRQGARCEAAPVDGEAARLAVAATAAVGARYAGVDLIPVGEGFQVLEVNSMPAWHGLQGVCAVDIAQALADDALGLVRT
ncbi:MAG: RimK family alpha-L-glutamate ligase [Alphaproteobacteria bacterium]|nr:RimK family alpha-L-glutamate ligase [Alphaproteobacteria bacterium]